MKNESAFVKESRFSYIIPIDGATRLIVYSYSNITGLEKIVHRGSKIVVAVPDGCIIIFTNHTIHDGVKSYEKQGGMYSSHLRMPADIVEYDCVQITDDISKLLSNDECIQSCATYGSLINENICYKDYTKIYLKICTPFDSYFSLSRTLTEETTQEIIEKLEIVIDKTMTCWRNL